MSNETENGLTVEKVRKLDSIGDGAYYHRDGDDRMKDEVWSSAEIIIFLLAKLATIERDTAEKCAELVDDNRSLRDSQRTIRGHISAVIYHHFNLGDKT
jgi:hypothetical protein